MHVVAIPSSFATSINILFALSIHEIGDSRELSLDFLPIEETTIDILLCVFRVVILSVFDINIANNMITKIINHNHIFNFAILHHFLKDFLVEPLILGHGCLGISPADIISINECSFDCVVLIHMFETDCFGQRRLVMNSLATVPVPACTHLVEEGTIHLIHLGPVDLRQAVGHLIIIDLGAQTSL